MSLLVARWGNRIQRVVATQAIDREVLDGRQGDDRQRIDQNRPRVRGSGSEYDGVSSRGAIDNDGVAGGRIAAVDGDAVTPNPAGEMLKSSLPNRPFKVSVLKPLTMITGPSLTHTRSAPPSGPRLSTEIVSLSSVAFTVSVPPSPDVRLTASTAAKFTEAPPALIWPVVASAPCVIVVLAGTKTFNRSLGTPGAPAAGRPPSMNMLVAADGVTLNTSGPEEPSTCSSSKFEIVHAAGGREL